MSTAETAVHIMDGHSSAVIDVRDMLCSQALAVVAQALGGLPAGGIADVLYNAEDVRQDLLVWAEGQGLCVSEPNLSTLRIQRP